MRLLLMECQKKPFDLYQNTAQIIEKLFDKNSNMSLSSDLKEGFWFGSSLNLRGKIFSSKEISEVECHAQDVLKKNQGLSRDLKLSLCESPFNDHHLSVALNVNSSTIRFPLQGLADRFNALFSKKAFLSYYLQEGLEEDDFSEAFSCLKNLLTYYQEQRDD